MTYDPGSGRTWVKSLPKFPQVIQIHLSHVVLMGEVKISDGIQKASPKHQLVLYCHLGDTWIPIKLDALIWFASKNGWFLLAQNEDSVWDHIMTWRYFVSCWLYITIAPFHDASKILASLLMTMNWDLLESLVIPLLYIHRFSKSMDVRIPVAHLTQHITRCSKERNATTAAVGSSRNLKSVWPFLIAGVFP